MTFNKIKNTVTSKKNIAAKNKDSWEWRYFFYDEKLKETIVKEILVLVFLDPHYLEMVILMNADFAVCYNNFLYF